MADTLVDKLVVDGQLRTPQIIEAFRRVSRSDFLPADMRDQANVNLPLPIGQGQTNSQPLTVAIMMELLKPQSGEAVLDVGCGSGWTTALLAEIVGESGKVVGVERINEIFQFGLENLKKAGYLKKGNVELYCADGSKGYIRHAPYNRILVSAMGNNIPEALISQLAAGGVLVMPIQNSVWYIEKKTDGDLIRKEYPGFSFVPLIEGE